jgi:hypothetical protein
MSSPISLHNINVPNFLKVLDQCVGDVFLVTEEGDRLNLRSKLCQLVGLTRLIEGGSIAEASVLCELQEDETRLFRFNLYAKVEE